MAVLDGQPAAADADDPVGSALGKIIRALPENVGRQAAALREHASAAPDRRSVRPDPAITSALVAAVAARRRGDRLPQRVRQRVEGRGRPLGGRRALRPVVPAVPLPPRRRDPHLPHRPGPRGAATATGSSRPPDLDPVAALEENLGTGWEYPTRVVFHAPPAGWRRGSGRRWDGSSRRGRVRAGRQHQQPGDVRREWLANVPFDFRVEGGPELRAAVVRLAARFAAAVAGGRSTGGQDGSRSRRRP